MTARYSPAFYADGSLVFVSGQTPEASDGSVADGDALEQTRQVLRNVETVLTDYGTDTRHLVKLTYYLRHIADLDSVRRALDDFLVHEPRPAATLVEVSGLADSRYLVEIEAVATLPRGERVTWVT